MESYKEESQIVRVYNSGLIVFLYDESFRNAINEASPKILEYYDDESHLDPKLKELADKGMLVVYELPQDDELAVEVSLGAPLTDAEFKELPLTKPSVTKISIPTGKLCIEGYDALQVGPDEPMEEGGMAEVQPGDYIMTLYRDNPYADEDENEDDEESEGPRRPNSLIILSTADKALAPGEIPPILKVPPIDPEDVPFDWKDRV